MVGICIAVATSGHGFAQQPEQNGQLLFTQHSKNSLIIEAKYLTLSLENHRIPSSCNVPSTQLVHSSGLRSFESIKSRILDTSTTIDSALIA